MAGCLGEADVSRDDGGVYLAREVALDLLRYLKGEVGTAVEHGEQNPLQREGGIQSPLD